jgi:hypothetical protein
MNNAAAIEEIEQYAVSARYARRSYAYACQAAHASIQRCS